MKCYTKPLPTGYYDTGERYSDKCDRCGSSVQFARIQTMNGPFTALHGMDHALSDQWGTYCSIACQIAR